MSEPTGKPAQHHPTAAAAGRQAGRVIVRIYAFAILLLVLWTGYTAIAYLARYVFRASRVPSQFLDPLAKGVPASQPFHVVPEPAVAHYHRDPQAFAFTGVAGCTASGCHSLLPHTKHKETRAFANFHSTFLDCSSCHDADVHAPAPAVWLNNRTGAQQDPPALLRLMLLLESKADVIQKTPAEVAPAITGLLREAESSVGVDPPLHDLLLLLDTSEPGSPVWTQAMTDLQATLPNRVRGEYAARITPVVVVEHWTERQARLAELTHQFASASGSQRDSINKQIHEKVVAKPEACLSCHGGEPARFDFKQLGYSSQRVETLRSTPVARMIQQIREGRPFYLPTLLERRDGK